MDLNTSSDRETSSTSKDSSDFDQDFLARVKHLIHIKNSRSRLQSIYSECESTTPSPTETKNDQAQVMPCTLIGEEATSPIEIRLALKFDSRSSCDGTNSPKLDERYGSSVSGPQPGSRAIPELEKTGTKAGVKPSLSVQFAMGDVQSSKIKPKALLKNRARLPWLDGARPSAPRRTAETEVPGTFSEGPSINELRIEEDSIGLDGKQLDDEFADRSSSMYVGETFDRVEPTRHDSKVSATSSEVFAAIELQQPVMRGRPINRSPLSVPPLRIPRSNIASSLDEGESQPAVPLVAFTRDFRRSESDATALESPTAVCNTQKESRPTSTPSRNSGGILKRPEPIAARISTSNRATRSPVAIQESIDGLENLMQQAVQLAREAAEQDNHKELPAILDQANTAILNAVLVREDQVERRAMGMPSKTRHDDHTSTYSTSSASTPIYITQEDIPWEPERAALRDAGLLKRRAEAQDDSSVADWAYKQRSAVDAGPRTKPMETSTNLHRRASRVTQEPQTKEQVQQHINRYGQPPIPDRRSSLGKTRPRMEGVDSPGTSPVMVQAESPFEGRRDITPHNWGRDKYDEKDYLTTDALKGVSHIVLKDGQHWSIHHHRRQPIARNWSDRRKRFTAFVACLNTALVGLLVGIYAGEVPAIQYALTDQHHYAILGNVLLYAGMATTTFCFWPLPLLHGRKPYTLAAFAIALPLQIPQAIMVQSMRDPNQARYRAGLLASRAISGLALGFAHVNFKATLLDLFGASLQSSHPHGEVVVVDDVRRHGGGMGLWLGGWSFCFIGSLSIGFLIGADIISGLNVSWGFWISVMLLALILILNVVTPETRRAPHRRTMQEVQLTNMNLERRVARGEIRMHVTGEGPKWWWEEVASGMYLSWKMFTQLGFFVMTIYLGWVYAQIVLVIVLLGNLLSAGYRWRPEYVGLGVLSIAVGALLAIPNTKANWFSRSRQGPPRTDSMTFQPRFTWTSHLVRRAIFMTVLPLAGIAYTLASAGSWINYMVPIVFAGVIGYVSNLAIAECHGLIMETFDTSDLQPGTNTRHRLQSLAASDKRRRTAYSSYPRVSAGFFLAHSLGFALAAVATGVGGVVTRAVGAQRATGIVAGVLFGFTILLTLALWRYKTCQVIPNELFGSAFGAEAATASGPADKRNSIATTRSDRSWRAVIIGNPSGKLRRLSLLELGSMSRWTEIRRLNKLLNRSTTQPLNPGWR